MTNVKKSAVYGQSPRCNPFISRDLRITTGSVPDLDDDKKSLPGLASSDGNSRRVAGISPLSTLPITDRLLEFQPCDKL